MTRLGKEIVLVLIVLLIVTGCGQPQPTATPVPPTVEAQAPTATAMPPPTATAEPTPDVTPTAIPSSPGNPWIKTYGGDQDVVSGNFLPAGDGGFFIIGTTNLQFEPERQGDVYLLRTDAAGEIVWEKTYGGDGYDSGHSVMHAGDGNLLIAGVTTSFGAAGMDAYLLKVDQDGNEIWQKTYGGPLDEMVGAVGQMDDGGFLLGGNIVDPDDIVAEPGAAGYGGLEGRSSPYALKVDGDGNELWSRTYDSGDNVLASGGRLTPDGGFLALATISRFPEPDDDILLLKLDGEGNELWSRTWQEGRTYPHSLITTSDGNYLITASYAPDGAREENKADYLFIKVDPEGNEIWQSIFGDPDQIDYGVVLAEAEDGGFVAAGERTPDHYTWEADIVLVKIDEEGQPLWEQVWPAAHTMLTALETDPAGGYAIGGAMFTDPVFNIVLIKTESPAEPVTSTPTPAPTDTPVPTPTPTPEPPKSFVRHVVEKDPRLVSGVYAYDVDGDGHLDVLAASMREHELAWWHNEGGDPIAWTKQVLAEDYSGAAFVQATDLDGDGDTDILSTAAGANTVDWWRNDGGDPITWSRQTVGEGLNEAQGLFAADLDGDGDTDILATAARLNTVAWWENDSPAGDGSSWVQHTIDDNFRNTQTVEAADFDLDGDLDVVAGAGDSNQVAWWRNDGGSPIAWTKQNISSHFRWAHWVHADDVDGDGRVDVLGAAYSDNEIAWWRNAGGDPIVWEPQTLDNEFLGALNVHTADLDGDGDTDVLGTANKSSHVAWWRNDGGAPIAWTKDFVDERAIGAWPVHTGDLDGDGDADVIFGGSSGTFWWENVLDQGAAGDEGQAAADAPAPGVDEVLAGLQGPSGQAPLPLDQFLEESYRQIQLRDPDTLLSNGLGAAYGVESTSALADISDAHLRETRRLEAAILDLLRGYDREALSSEQALAYDIYEWYLDDLVRGHEFAYYSYPVNGLGNWDMTYWILDLMTEAQPITGKEEAEAYIAQLSQLDTWAAQLTEGLKLREEAGVIPPAFIVQRAATQAEEYLQTRPGGGFEVEQIVLYTAFREQLEGLEGVSAEEKQALLDAARAEIEGTFVPAFDRLRHYLIELEGKADNKSGVWKHPQGEAYYAYILRHHTGTDLSPDEVHEMGLAEVARLQEQIRAAAAELGYPDLSMSELNEILEPQDTLPNGDELLAEYEQRIAAAESAASDFFDLYPGHVPAVEYDPAAPPAYYRQPPIDGSAPGAMIASGLHPLSYTYYDVPVLVHHETIPGHHVQLALAVELDLPNYRRDNIFNVYRQHLPFQAYVEGWALYAEQLAYEMGLYEDDPVGNLRRLRLRLHRTARMVADTGIHAKGWTGAQAADYMQEATGTPYSRDRLLQIIAIPGQACAYNVGHLKILEMRQRAMEQLGDAFDIKAFHNLVLGNGAMPITVLDSLVDDWIAASQSEA